jgi:hypothetical protein
MSKRITFIDQIGRTILAEYVDISGPSLIVKNPAMINVNQMQNGQLQVQLFPLFFAEFLSEKSRKEGTTWKFNLSQIATTDDAEVDQRLQDQYDRVFGLKSAAPAEAPVIKLFDDESK